MHEVLHGVAEYLKEGGVVIDDSEFWQNDIARIISTLVPYVMRLNGNTIELRSQNPQLSGIHLPAQVFDLNDPDSLPRLLKSVRHHTADFGKSHVDKA